MLNAQAGSRPNDQQTDNFEFAEEFEQRIFSQTPDSNPNTFVDKMLERLKDRNRYGSRTWGSNYPDEGWDTSTDGMDGKLKEAATYFEFDPEEVEQDDYAFRYDASYNRDLTYDIKVCVAALFFIYSNYFVFIIYLFVCLLVFHFILSVTY